MGFLGRNKQRYWLLVLTSLLFGPTLMAAQPDLLAEKINQRLGYMKDVAGDKAQRHLPVEDLAQEEKVLVSTQAEAKRLGLDAASVKPLVVAQMDAAKAIQYRYRAQWLAEPENDWQPRPLNVVRPRIARLSSEILQQLAQRLKHGPITEAERAAFMQAIAQPQLSMADKARLFDALQKVRVAEE